MVRSCGGRQRLLVASSHGSSSVMCLMCRDCDMLRTLLPMTLLASLLASPNSFAGILSAQPQVADPLPSEPQREAPVAEDEEDIATTLRRNRLQAQLTVFRHWTQTTADLSPSQLQRIRMICESELELSQTRWITDRSRAAGNRLPDFAPIEFTSTGGAADCVSRALLQLQIIGLLSDEQSARLDAAEAERREWLSSGDRQYLVSVIDEQLRLSADQQLLLDDEIRINRMDSQLFAWDNGDSPLTSISRLAVAARIDEIELTDEQRSRCVQLRLPQQSGQATVTFDAPVSADEVTSTLTQLAAQQKQRCEDDVARRVAAFQKGWMLSPDQAAMLKLAGKGATIRCLHDWKIRSEQWIRGMLEKPRGPAGLSLHMAAIDRNALYHHPIWVNALNSVRPQPDLGTGAVPDRNHQRRMAIAAWVLVTLDRELWLQPDQRQLLRQRINAILPAGMERMTAPGRELGYLAFTLSALSQAEDLNFLDDAQRHVWQLLQEQFHSDGRSVKIRRNDGSLFSMDQP